MKITVIAVADPTVMYGNDRQVTAYLSSFVVSTDTYYMPNSIVLEATGTVADSVANYIRCGSLVVVDVSISTDDVGGEHIHINAADIKPPTITGQQAPPVLLTELLTVC